MSDAVVDTSVLQYLHLLGRLDLLRQLFGRVLVPEQVAGELARGRELGHDLPDPRAVTWLEVYAVEPADHGALDLGETAVLTLAAPCPARSWCWTTSPPAPAPWSWACR